MADQENKKRRGRRAYLEDFHKTATGDYVYEGATHPYPAQKLSRRQALARLWTAAAAMAALALLGGCLPAAGMQNTFYVILPWAAGLISAGAVVWLMCRLSAGGDPLRDYVYTATVQRFGQRGVAVTVCAGLTLTGELLCLALQGPGERLPGSLALLASQGLLLAAGLWWLHFTRRLKW